MIRRLLKGVGANALMQLVVVVLQLALVPIFATHWGLERYGVWLLLFTIPAYLAQGDFGFGTAAGNDMIMKVARGDRHGALVTYQSARAAIFVISVAVCLAASAVVVLAPDAWLQTGGLVSVRDVRIILIIMILYGLICLLGSLNQAGFRSVGQYSTGVVLAAITGLIEGATAGAIVLAGGEIWEVALGYLAIRATSIVVITFLMLRAVPFLNLRLDQVSMDEVRRLWPLALGVMVLPITQAIFLQGTVAVVGFAASAAAVAVFTSVRTLVRSGVQMTTLLNHALMPELSRASAQGDGSVPAMVLLTALGSLVVVVPGAVVLLVWGPDIIRIWTHGTIHPPYAFLAAMVGVMVVNGFWHPLSNLLLASNRQRSYSYIYLVASLACLALAYPLVAGLGVLGAGLALLGLDLFMAQHVIRKVHALLLNHMDVSTMVQLCRSVGAAAWQRVRARLKST